MSRLPTIARILLLCCLHMFSLSVAYGQVDITTWQVDLQHTGANLQETTLSPGNVGSPGNFGLLFTHALDGQSYGQPLYVSAATLGPFNDASTHNVVYVATQHDSVFAFDADSSGGANAGPLWRVSLLPPGTTPVPQADTQSGDIQVEIGITTTPVIDTANQLLYVVSKVKKTSDGSYQQYLHALDLKTGAEKLGPVRIDTSFAGSSSQVDSHVPECTSNNAGGSSPQGALPFCALREHLRSAMILYNGVVYIAYASHSDMGVYHGEILGYDAHSLALIKTFIATPNGANGGFWASGAGPAVDASGNMFIAVANGDFDQRPSAYTTGTDWGEAVLKLPTGTTGQMDVSFSNPADWFTPNNFQVLNDRDLDVGSSGLLLLPDQSGGTHPHILVGGGKGGVLYVLDRDNLGGIATPDNAIQEIAEDNSSALFVTPAYYNGNIYYAPAGLPLEQRAVGYEPISGGYVSQTAITSDKIYRVKGAGAFVSANGANDGLVWVLSGNNLDAYDARNVSGNPIFTQNLTTPITNTGCGAPKFSLPTVSGGKAFYSCFDGATNASFLFVSGLLAPVSGTPVAASGAAASAISSSAATITWTDNDSRGPGFIIKRSNVQNGTFSQVGTVSAHVTTFTDTGLSPVTPYFYQVVAFNANGNSSPSNVAAMTTFPNFTPPGLVAYWSLDDGSSNPTDNTGHGHTGLTDPGVNEAVPSQAIINMGYSFHGAGQVVSRIDVPDSPELEFATTQSFTLAAWVNLLTIKAEEQAILAKSADQGNAYGIWVDANGHWIARGPQGDIVGPVATQGTWTHVAVVQDGAAGTRGLYVNGVLVASGSAQAADGAGDLWMGQQNVDGNVESFIGLLDEIRLYNIALTSDQITGAMGPPVVDAVSNQHQGNSGTFGLTLFPSITNNVVEPRRGSTPGSYTIALTFSAPVSGAHVALGLQGGGAPIGSIAAVTPDNTGRTLTVALTGVANDQALNLHFSGILPGNGTADIPFNLLWGDVDGNHVVNNLDLVIVQNSATQGVNQASAFFDISGDGAVNGADAALVSAAIGSTLGAQTDANLAVFQPATASSVNGGNTAPDAFDNNPNSRWESQQNVDPQCIKVDLGAVATIHSIVLNWENAAGKNYTLDVSSDPKAANDCNSTTTDQGVWSTIKQVVGNTSGGVKTYANLNASGRYVRMFGTTRTTGFGYSLFEFQVFGIPLSGTQPPPAAPANLAAVAAAAQISLTWTASPGATSYEVFRGSSAGGENATPVAMNLVTPAFVDASVTSGATYFYIVKAINAAGVSGPSNEASATPTATATIPAAPTNLAAVAGNASVVLNWNASTGAASYNVYRGTSAGAENATPLASNVTASTYTDTTVVAGIAYFYQAAAVNSAGISARSNEAMATTSQGSSGPAIYQINSGGPALAPFAADAFFDTGATSNTGNPVSTAGVANAAPMAVYQTDRFGGNFTYTLPGLTPGASYAIRLHFAETFWTAAAKRQFNVAINGLSVLSNFDIFASAGGANKALVETFTTTANSSGQVVIAFTRGSADLPKANAIEVVPDGTAGGGLPLPAAPQGLTATSGGGSIALSWNPGAGAAGTYVVYRGTTPGGEDATAVASGLTSTSFIDTQVQAQVTYYYVVAAANTTGMSAFSNEASAMPGTAVSGMAIYQVGTANHAIPPYAADAFFSGGNESGSAKIVDTSSVINPAPMAVYQGERSGGSFQYTFPNLHAGTTYLVRLHFAEVYWTATGRRIFNVAINGNSVLQNFDIVATAGAPNTALVQQFQAIADTSGNIRVTFSRGSVDQPKVSAIEIYQP
jgi:fibronectin type 3 domain-containing protein